MATYWITQNTAVVSGHMPEAGLRRYVSQGTHARRGSRLFAIKRRVAPTGVLFNVNSIHESRLREADTRME